MVLCMNPNLECLVWKTKLSTKRKTFCISKNIWRTNIASTKLYLLVSDSVSAERSLVNSQSFVSNWFIRDSPIPGSRHSKVCVHLTFLFFVAVQSRIVQCALDGSEFVLLVLKRRNFKNKWFHSNPETTDSNHAWRLPL